MNKNTTDKGEAIDQLISGLDFSMAKGLNVMAIVVLGKQENAAVIETCLFCSPRTDGNLLFLMKYRLPATD